MNNTLTLSFETAEQLDWFDSWFSNEGEQMYFQTTEDFPPDNCAKPANEFERSKQSPNSISIVASHIDDDD